MANLNVAWLGAYANKTLKPFMLSFKKLKDARLKD